MQKLMTTTALVLSLTAVPALANVAQDVFDQLVAEGYEEIEVKVKDGVVKVEASREGYELEAKYDEETGDLISQSVAPEDEDDLAEDEMDEDDMDDEAEDDMADDDMDDDGEEYDEEEGDDNKGHGNDEDGFDEDNPGRGHTDGAPGRSGVKKEKKEKKEKKAKKSKKGKKSK